MKILLISPLGFPANKDLKYGGIERLVYEYARELNKEHDVTVMGHLKSVYANGVKLLPTNPQPQEDIFVAAELRQYETYRSYLREFDVIHDFSHQHFASRFRSNLSSLNLFWHAPSVARFPKASYNIIGLSRWACKEFEHVYRQRARYQPSIVIDTDTYKPSGKRGDRFLTIGIMNANKGNLRAIEFCRQAGVPLDVVGASADKLYEAKVRAACDGKDIVFHGEVSHDDKIRLMQSCKALIYANIEPEVTSHKVQETLLCGAPIICSKLGALPEIVTHGVDGWLCGYDGAFIKALGKVDGLKLDYEALKARYNPKDVVNSYIPLYESVANGERW